MTDIKSLRDAAEVFAQYVPDWLDPNASVGQIAGVTICAGDVRKLAAALVETQSSRHLTMNEEILMYLRERKLIHAIQRHRELTGSSLIESKTYVESLAVKNGFREWDGVRTYYTWTDKTIPVAD